MNDLCVFRQEHLSKGCFSGAVRSGDDDAAGRSLSALVHSTMVAGRKQLPLADSELIVVWGGPARFVYHGVAPLKDGQHPFTGATHMSLTFRKVF